MEKRKGSGRTVGSVSFAQVTLAELNRVLKPDCVVLVSRRFAEMLKIEHTPASGETERVKSLAVPPAQVKEIDLE